MTSFSDIINANIRQRRAADAADADRFALTVFDDVQLGTVERCEATNVTTFPDIIDDAGHYFSVYGSLAYALAAARDYITVGGPS